MARWGYWRWLLDPRLNLASLVFYGWFQGGNEEVHNQARHLLGDFQYYRRSPSVSFKEVFVALLMGDAEKVVRRVRETAESYINEGNLDELTVAWQGAGPWLARSPEMRRAQAADFRR